jgi:hypothetical protein
MRIPIRDVVSLVASFESFLVYIGASILWDVPPKLTLTTGVLPSLREGRGGTVSPMLETFLQRGWRSGNGKQGQMAQPPRQQFNSTPTPILINGEDAVDRRYQASWTILPFIQII